MNSMRSAGDSAGLSILVASSEALPLAKTGGLADVATGLSVALRALGHDARLIIPAYPCALRRARELKPIRELYLPGVVGSLQLLSSRLPEHDLPVYLVDAPDYFRREGNPYLDLSGRDWGDNAERFFLFARVIAALALGLPAFDWRPQVLHCHDWQTGLAPVLLRDRDDRPAIVFTIHNLVYQGLFDRAVFDRLGLPPTLWSVTGLEFHQRMSFLKGGIVFSDLINTVSPNHAEEVRTSAHGCGLDGLLRQASGRFTGILNGIDYSLWDPRHDPVLPQPYDRASVHLKAENKLELQRHFGLPRDERLFVLAHAGRLVEYKGTDLLLDTLPALLEDGQTQIVVEGTGTRELERRWREMAVVYPDQVGVFIGHDEARAHLLAAGSDACLMPSRFEPCGLQQMYGLRYGTVPIARRTGGLADTIVDCMPDTLAAGTATGFLFDEATADALLVRAQAALALWREQPAQWRTVVLNGMARDFSWKASARAYERFYLRALAAREELAIAASA